MYLHYLAIPIIIGIVVGGSVLGIYEINSNDSKTLLTSSKLIENGSPILGVIPMHQLQ